MQWASNRLAALETMYPQYPESWEYMYSQWLNRVHMWVVDYRNLSYTGQDTNAAIKGYHVYVKSILKTEWCRLAGHRVDWTMKIMVKVVTRHYWYLDFCKMYGFVDNWRNKTLPSLPL